MSFIANERINRLDGLFYNWLDYLIETATLSELHLLLNYLTSSIIHQPLIMLKRFVDKSDTLKRKLLKLNGIKEETKGNEIFCIILDLQLPIDVCSIVKLCCRIQLM